MQPAGIPHKRKIRVLTIILLVAGVSVYFSFDPVASAYFPPCFFYKFTGYQCPGCGTQRAVHSLLHLDFVPAFLHNPLLLPALLLVIILVYLDIFGGKKRFPRMHRYFSGTKFITIVGIVIILYWIGRNLFLPVAC